MYLPNDAASFVSLLAGYLQLLLLFSPPRGQSAVITPENVHHHRRHYNYHQLSAEASTASPAAEGGVRLISTSSAQPPCTLPRSLVHSLGIVRQVEAI